MKARSDRRWIKRCRYWRQQARLHRLAARGPVVWANKIYAIFLDDDDGDPVAYAPVSPRMMVYEHMDMHSRVIHATPDAGLSRKDLMAYYALYNSLPFSPYAHVQSEGWSVSLSHPSPSPIPKFQLAMTARRRWHCCCRHFYCCWWLFVYNMRNMMRADVYPSTIPCVTRLDNCTEIMCSSRSLPKPTHPRRL